MQELNDLLDAIQTVEQYFYYDGFYKVYYAADKLVIEYGCDDWSQYVDNISLGDDYKFDEERLLDQVKKDVKGYVERNGLFFDKSHHTPGGFIFSSYQGFVPLKKKKKYKQVVDQIKEFKKQFDYIDGPYNEDNGFCFYLYSNKIFISQDSIKLNDQNYNSINDLVEKLKTIKDKVAHIKIRASSYDYDDLRDIIDNVLSQQGITAFISYDYYENTSKNDQGVSTNVWF